MISALWIGIAGAMGKLGYSLVDSEGDSLVDRRYVIRLPRVERDDQTSAFAKARVVRTIELRLQFKDSRDVNFQSLIAQDIERVVVAMRGLNLLFETAGTEQRPGGWIADVQFTAVDSMN